MSFASAENARQTQPIECLTFAQGNDAWFYTTHDVDITRVGVTYRAALVERDSFNQSDEGDQSSVTVRLEINLPLAQHLITKGLRSTRGPMMFRLILTHLDDTNIYVPFVGRCTFLNKLSTHVELTIESERSLFKQRILHVTGGNQCNHILYGVNCAVDKTLFATDVTIDDVSGRTITVSTGGSLADEQLAGGYLEVGPDQFFIEHNTGLVLTSIGNVTPDIIGLAGVAYDGCDRSYNTCRDKFSNVRRYGGFPLFPVNNPFNGRFAKPRNT